MVHRSHFKPLLIGLLAAFALSAQQVSADVIRHFDPPGTFPGQFPGVTTLLDTVGIGGDNAASETIATAFIVPGIGPVDLTFTQIQDFGGFQFSFGFYDLSTVSADPATDKLNYAIQALTGATEVFDDRFTAPGDTATLTVDGGTMLGFYMLPNNTLANFLADPGQFYPPVLDPLELRAPLFSVSDADPGEFDQFLSFIGNGKTLFTWEDLTRDGPTDLSFTDLAFTIDAELDPGIVPEPSSVATWVIGAGMPVLWGLRRGRRARK